MEKNALFRYFWARILKNYFHIWNHHPQIYIIVKFCKKIKMSKFGTKNALFGFFRARILKKLLSYLKSTPWNLFNSKMFWRNKNCLNLGPAMPYLSIFGVEFLKVFSYLKSAPSTLSKNDFGIESAFSKGAGSVYSEGPGPCLGLCPGALYKVYPAYQWSRIF